MLVNTTNITFLPFRPYQLFHHHFIPYLISTIFRPILLFSLPFCSIPSYIIIFTIYIITTISFHIIITISSHIILTDHFVPHHHHHFVPHHHHHFVPHHHHHFVSHHHHHF